MICVEKKPPFLNQCLPECITFLFQIHVGEIKEKVETFQDRVALVRHLFGGVECPVYPAKNAGR